MLFSSSSSSNLKLSYLDFLERDFSESRAREKEKNKPRHHHVIFMDCTVIEHGSRQISAREIAQLLKYFLT